MVKTMPVLATNVIRADSGGEVRVVKDVVTAASRNRSRQQRPSSGSSLVDWMRSRGRHLLHWSAGGGGAEPARPDAWQLADRAGRGALSPAPPVPDPVFPIGTRSR